MIKVIALCNITLTYLKMHFLSHSLNNKWTIMIKVKSNIAGN